MRGHPEVFECPPSRRCSLIYHASGYKVHKHSDAMSYAINHGWHPFLVFFALPFSVTVQVVETVSSSEGTACALRCDRIALPR
jgi:hypothetical protein